MDIGNFSWRMHTTTVWCASFWDGSGSFVPLTLTFTIELSIHSEDSAAYSFDLHLVLFSWLVTIFNHSYLKSILIIVFSVIIDWIHIKFIYATHEGS